MEPNNEAGQDDSFPKIPSNDLDDDENPYKKDFENDNKFKKSDTIKLDPEKDNISDQLGLEFDYPTETKVFGDKENNDFPKPYNDNNNINNDRNILDNFDKPIDINDLPNNNNNFMNNNNNNNFPNNNNNFANNNNNMNNNNNYGNNNNYNQNNNNYANNFGGPNNYNNNNNFNNNNYNNNYNNNNYNNYNNNFNNNNYNNNNFNNNNNNNNNDEFTKKIQNILNVCDTKYKNAIAQFKNFQIIESKIELNKLMNNLTTLEKTAKDKNVTSLLPTIISLKNNITNKFYEYNYFTYILNSSLFKNIQYQKNTDLAKFAEKFILNRSFISFNDIYDTTLDQNKPTKSMILEIYERAQKSGYKTLFLYGPNGSGKTLYVHALAAELGAVLGQLDNLQFIKIQFFVKEFARLMSEYRKRPVIIYIKNVDALSRNALGEILFLMDKYNGSKQNALLIGSSPFPVKNLPQKLQFNYKVLINSANQNNKINLFKFMINKFGIKIPMNDGDLNNFVYQNLRNYSNRDIFNVIKAAMNLKKESGGNIFEIGRNELEKAIKSTPGSLDPQCMQFYGL